MLFRSNDKTDTFQLQGFNDSLKLKKDDATDVPAPQAPSDYAKPKPIAKAAEKPHTTEESDR